MSQGTKAFVYLGRKPKVQVATFRLDSYRAATFFILLLATLLAVANGVVAQTLGHTLYGDLKVDDGDTNQNKPLSYSILLYAQDGRVLARQTVTNHGRYRFNDVPDGEYNIVVELENNEVARLRVTVASPLKTDFRHDIRLEWRSDFVGKRRKDAPYKRQPESAALFTKAGEALKKESYDQAVAMLRQVVSADAKDFEAWTELGTALLSQGKNGDAEKAYVAALAAKPDYLLALINLGRLRLKQKNLEGAIESLDQAVRIQPESASANYYLGEAYLQTKKGSKAVIYFNRALKLDPLGRAEAHLRLAALYNAAGLKDKAAAEYESFLEKKPDFPNKKKLQQYVSETKKQKAN